MSKDKHWCRDISMMAYCDHPECSGVNVEAGWECGRCYIHDACTPVPAPQPSSRDAINVCDHPAADPTGKRDSTEAFRWAAVVAMRRSQPSPRGALVEEVRRVAYRSDSLRGGDSPADAVDTVVARIVERLKVLCVGNAAICIEREFGPKGGG